MKNLAGSYPASAKVDRCQLVIDGFERMDKSL